MLCVMQPVLHVTCVVWVLFSGLLFFWSVMGLVARLVRLAYGYAWSVCGCLRRDDIPLAAVDFHVAPALTQHLKEQPQLKAAVRSMIAASPAGWCAGQRPWGCMFASQPLTPCFLLTLLFNQAAGMPQPLRQLTWK